VFDVLSWFSNGGGVHTNPSLSMGVIVATIAPLYHVQALNMMLVLHVKWANMFSEHFNLFLFEVKYFFNFK
jgi:hypothetical protein